MNPTVSIVLYMMVYNYGVEYNVQYMIYTVYSLYKDNYIVQVMTSAKLSIGFNGRIISSRTHVHTLMLITLLTVPGSNNLGTIMP